MPSTRISRLRELQVEDRSVLDALLDQATLAHIGIVVDDHPVVVPTAFARDGDRILCHGSTGSAWMRAVADGAPTSVCVTAVDGLSVARSAFESSYLYRSAVLFGTFERLEDDGKALALEVMIDHLLPGRRSEVRDDTRRELQRTMVLSLPITTWSLKVSDGYPEDPLDDVAGPAWAGVVPFEVRAGRPVPAPDLRPGIAVPDSVRALDPD